MPTSTEQRPVGVGRPSAARARILAVVERLFYDEGIQAVGIHRIVDEAAVTRVTLYRHFPSKDDLITAYLQQRAQRDQVQVTTIVTAHPDDPRRALTELATVLTRDDFATIRRGCPFINAAAEFPVGHPVREHATRIRGWITGELETLLTALRHRSPASTAQQLMMVRTGAVMSGALDRNPNLTDDFLDCWNLLIDGGLPSKPRGRRRPA